MSRALLLIASAAVAVGLAAGAAASRWDAIERQTVDARFAVRGERAAPRELVIVAYDDPSFLRLPRPPLSRDTWAAVTRRLEAAGARVIAFDIAFPQRTGDADRRLVRTLDGTGRAVVSVAQVASDGSIPPLAGLTPFAETSVRPGLTWLPRDPDGAIRRFPENHAGVQSFAAAVASRALEREITPPPDALIDYRKRPETLSLVDVLDGRIDVRERIVLIGETAPILGDRHRTSVAGATPGVEIHAAAVATALAGFPLRAAGAGWWLGLPALVTLLVGLLRAWRATWAVALTGAAVTAGWAVAAQLAFGSGRIVDFTAGVAAIAGATLVLATAATAHERAERRRLRRAFAEQGPAAVDPALARAPGGIIAGYQIEEELGGGGMGDVFRARQLHLDRPVALKLIKPTLADDPVFRERFIAESRLVASLSHPNVIPVFDAGDDDGLLYIAMQPVDGLDLSAWLHVLGRLEPRVAASVISQVAGALDAAHAARLVHRDVKPANVLLTDSTPVHAYLADFGLAQVADDDTPLTGAGTREYMAPEALLGRPLDQRADVYSLAAVACHCLTGEPRAICFTPAVDAVLARGLAADPAARYGTAGAFSAALQVALGLAEVPAAIPPPVRPPPGARTTPLE